MASTLNHAWINAPHHTRIFEVLGEENVRFIGGCVRDALLGRTIQDVDMATRLTPQEVITRFKKAGIKTVPAGIKHGTVTVVIDRIPVEITTLRSDIECHGRHAQVQFTHSWEEDAKRRDFTLNALSCDRQGNIYDYTHGQRDLQQGILQFIGDAATRCKEDYLRILRYFRFFATLGFEKLNDAALTACQQEKAGIEQLSGERIQHEMFKLLTAPTALIALKLMEKTGVLAMVGLNPKSLYALGHLEAIELAVKSLPQPITRLALLCRLSQWMPHQLDAFAKRWKLSNLHKQQLHVLCFPAQDVTPSMDETTHHAVMRDIGKEAYLALLMIHWAMENDNAQDAAYLTLYKQMHAWEVPHFPLQGKDLLAAGIPAGKTMGKLLKAAEDYWESHDYAPSKEALLAWVLQRR